MEKAKSLCPEENHVNHSTKKTVSKKTPRGKNITPKKRIEYPIGACVEATDFVRPSKATKALIKKARAALPKEQRNNVLDICYIFGDLAIEKYPGAGLENQLGRMLGFDSFKTLERRVQYYLVYENQEF